MCVCVCVLVLLSLCGPNSLTKIVESDSLSLVRTFQWSLKVKCYLFIYFLSKNVKKKNNNVKLNRQKVPFTLIRLRSGYGALINYLCH